MTKSPDAFRTISEVADDLDLPQHVLRFWETRFTQIKPLKRGGGRRYYRPDDVLLLRGIKHLLYGEGYTIKGVQRILREQGLRHVMGLWRDEVSEPEKGGEASSRGGHEAYAPKADRPRGLEPVFTSGENDPAIYARSPGAVTGRRPNFEPIVDDEEVEDEEEDADEEEEEDEETAEGDESEDGEEEDEDDEESDETEDSDEESDEDEEESDDEEDEDEEEGEAEPAGLTPEDRQKLEQALRELTELRHALDGA
jgi:DNA-binding transcriptional MerR regulator